MFSRRALSAFLFSPTHPSAGFLGLLHNGTGSRGFQSSTKDSGNRVKSTSSKTGGTPNTGPIGRSKQRLLNRDVSDVELNEVHLSPEVQMAISMETQQFRERVKKSNEGFEHDARQDMLLQRQLTDGFHQIRQKWYRVQQALDGDDEALRIRAERQLRQAFEETVRMDPGADQVVQQLHSQMPAEARQYFELLKKMDVDVGISAEDIAFLRSHNPDGSPRRPSTSSTPSTPPPSAGPPDQSAQGKSSGQTPPVGSAKERPPMTFEDLFGLLQHEHGTMTDANELPPMSSRSGPAAPLSAEELAHHRKLMAFEMQKHPEFFQMMAQMTGISPEQAMEEIMSKLGGAPSSSSFSTPPSAPKNKPR